MFDTIVIYTILILGMKTDFGLSEVILLKLLTSCKVFNPNFRLVRNLQTLTELGFFSSHILTMLCLWGRA